MKQTLPVRITRVLQVLLLVGMVTTLLSACGGDPRLQQEADQSRASLDTTIHYAQNIGVPATNLQSILTQEQALNMTNAPLQLFNDQPINEYYRNLSARYTQLKVQTQGIVQVTTEQLGQKAQDDLQTLQRSLAAKQNAGLPLATLTQLYNQNVASMQNARYPKDYSAISSHARDAMLTIYKMPDTMERLQTLNSIISYMQEGHQDASDLQQQYNDDKGSIAKATTPAELQQINQTIDSQNQQAIARFTQVIPQLAQVKVDELNSKVQQLQQYGIDTSNYRKRLDADRAQMASVKTFKDYQNFAKLVDTDLAAMSKDLLKGQTMTLIKQFHKEVDDWGNAHQFHDQYNGQNYPLDGPYMTKGIGEDLDKELNSASTADDYQQALTDTQNALLHLHLMQQDANDLTPYTQSHATDQQLMGHYKLQQSRVIVVSFIEEALRVYDHGRLVRSFLITAGRPELPPVPGLWPPMWRRVNIVFKSPYPQGSPYWYPDTPIHYAILYHEGGYYLHDSWWRNDYGPGTQFYHIDSSGNVSANYGTHGCINIPLDQAEWVYNNTDYNTRILMY